MKKSSFFLLMSLMGISLMFISFFLLACRYFPKPEKKGLSFTSVLKEGTSPIPSFSLKFINEQVLPKNQPFQNMPVGGLSALTYDSKNKLFLALSDDKGNKGFPPRFYKFKLSIKNSRYFLKLVDQVILRDSKNQPFTPIDPEGMALLYNSDFNVADNKAPKKNQSSKKPQSIRKALFNDPLLLISSEGAQMPSLLAPPQIFSFNLKGQWSASLPILDSYWRASQVGKWGVKENKAFEALSIDPKQKYVYFATEASLHQDDITPSFAYKTKPKNQQYIRINQWDIKQEGLFLKNIKTHKNPSLRQAFIKPRPNKTQATGKNIKYQQYIYTMDKKIEQNNMKGLNGLTDFIALGNHQLLTVERAYLKKPGLRKHKKMDTNWVRLFLTDCSKASDIVIYNQLNQTKYKPTAFEKPPPVEQANSNKTAITTCGKTLIADLSSTLTNPAPVTSIVKKESLKQASIKVDNIEGIALGPLVSKETYLLVLVSDNNFSQKQKTQFLFFHYNQ